MSDQIRMPHRTLMGPGPSDVSPRVLGAMSLPLVGHLDPAFLSLMNGTMDLLRYVFETDNRLTVAMPGTGSAGMETAFVNFIEPGDDVVIGVAGLFGERMVDVAGRCGARVHRVDAAWGTPLDPQAIRDASLRHRPRLVAVVHAETSTGVLQPLADIAAAVEDADSLLLVDCVTSLGGTSVDVDRLGIDIAYAGTQKCLSCPPGLAPVTVSDRAQQVLNQRQSKVASWYLDLTMISDYWGSERVYHHTAPISMAYGLYEGLRIIREEGLAARFERHLKLGRALQAGLIAMGLILPVEEPYRLPMLTSVAVPKGADDVAVRRQLLERYGIEIGGGLGELKGRAWRVGLMGHSCRPGNVLGFLAALQQVLQDMDLRVDGAAGQAAAAHLLKDC